MTPRQFVLLAIAAIVSTLAALTSFALNDRWSQGSLAGTRLFPALAGDLGKVGAVEIKQGAATTNDESLISRALLLNPIRGPNRELDRGTFPSVPAEAAANPALRDGVRALLTVSLDNTLPSMLRR